MKLHASELIILWEDERKHISNKESKACIQPF